MTQPRFLRAVEATSVALFFLQALRVVFSTLFGIIYDQVFVGPPGWWLFGSIGLVVLALAAPALSPRSPHRTWMAITASLTAVARVTLSVDDARLRFWGCLLVLAFGGLYLAGLMIARRPVAMPAFVGALIFDQLLRILGNTYDLSLRPSWLPVQLAWAVVVVVVAAALGARSAGGDRRASLFGIRAGLGLGAFLFLESSLLALPNAAARWSAEPYEVLAPILLLVTFLPVIPRWRLAMHHGMAGSSVLRVALAIVVLAGIISGYFLPGLPSLAGLILAQVAALACLSPLLDGRPSRPRSVGGMLALGLLLMFLLNLINAFAFTYPYSLPALRGLGWTAYLLAAVAFGAGVLAQHPVALTWNELSARAGVLLPGAIAVMAAALWAIQPGPVPALPDDGILRLATYNIHYGYDKDWHFNIESIAQTLEQNQVDVVALQEVDTGRLTSYGVDDAVYLARRLHMHAAYLPAVEHLTGVAVLYRGPAAPVQTHLLTSHQEQTGIVHVRVGSETAGLDFYGTWLGLENEDTQTQIGEALAFIGDHTPAAFGADFNSAMGSPVASAIQAAGFSDPFTDLGVQPIPLTDPAVQPSQRIDFVWLRGLRPLQAWVPDSVASDHRMVVVEVKTGG